MSCPLCAASFPMEFHRDAVAVARLSDEFACRGHSVLVARHHVENVSDLAPDDAARFFEVYRNVEAKLLDVFQADRVLAVKLGLAVPHLHVHLYPVSKEVTRTEVDAILARRVRSEPTPDELDSWLTKLRG